MEKILLVEDDNTLSFITKRYLESKGYIVSTAFSVEEAKEVISQNNFDLILLDMMLPDGEGTSICAFVREKSVCPIIFVSCLSDQLSKISALNLGGDDYIVKPVNYEELLTRIQINIRRAKQYNQSWHEGDELSFSGLRLNKKTHEVWITEGEKNEDILLDLSPIEYALLLCLIERSGELVLYQDLYQSVWHMGDMGDIRTVMVHVSNLRKKLGACGKDLIHTVRSAGYIFKV